MIPRFKPTLGIQELLAALHPARSDDIEQFENDFAHLMGQKHALAFAYGRTGMIHLLKAIGLENKEIICPSYTCIVVPHAIVFSGNRPVFVDCAEGGFNMDLDKVEKAITPKTGAIISTSLFGYPVDLDRLSILQHKYPHISIIQDCAHSYGAEWNGIQIQQAGIAAVFGLNISKMITSIFGGMVTTNDSTLFKKLSVLRNQSSQKVNRTKSLRRFAYLLSCYPVFWEPIYGLVNWLERKHFIDHFVKYYDELLIDMPDDYQEQMTAIEARVGRANINHYFDRVKSCRQAAHMYFDRLGNRIDMILPPQIHGATYSHFVVRVKDPDYWLKKATRKGIQLGWIIEYNIPEVQAYGCHSPQTFPVSAEYSRSAINLPVWGGEKLADRICRLFEND